MPLLRELMNWWASLHDRRRRFNAGCGTNGSLLSRVLELCRVHGVEIDPSMAHCDKYSGLEGLGSVSGTEPESDLLSCLSSGRGRGNLSIRSSGAIVHTDSFTVFRYPSSKIFRISAVTIIGWALLDTLNCT
jgi:hypothetical protein